MSSHLQSYLGPYVCVTERKQTAEKKVLGCPHKDWEKFSGKTGRDGVGDFCSKCGTKHAKVSYTYDVATDLAELVDENLTQIGEATGKGYLYLIPNVRRRGEPKRELDVDALHLNLTTLNIAQEIDWLGRAFAVEIEKLKQAYDDVGVSWGFHQYWR